MIRRFYKLLLFVLLLYYLPILLVLFDVIPFEYRFHTLVIMTIVMIVHSIVHKTSIKALGFRRDTLKKSLIWNLGISAVLIVAIYLSHICGLIREPTVPKWSLFLLFYVLISSPSQEYLYRSLIFSEMDKHGLENPLARILISSVNFCFLHVIYRDLTTLGVTLFMGLVWGYVYYKHPNFWGVAISHSIIGAVSILFGVI